MGPYAGSGGEGTLNGPGDEATLAQPSGLALASDGRLFFADSESSAIRWVDTESPERMVGVLAGSDADLFSFGDLDGVGTEARLQHPLGVVVVGDTLYMADTYNSKVKAVDLGTGEVSTLWGDTPGWRDGVAPLFYEPGGIDAMGSTAVRGGHQQPLDQGGGYRHGRGVHPGAGGDRGVHGRPGQ